MSRVRGKKLRLQRLEDLHSILKAFRQHGLHSEELQNRLDAYHSHIGNFDDTWSRNDDRYYILAVNTELNWWDEDPSISNLETVARYEYERKHIQKKIYNARIRDNRNYYEPEKTILDMWTVWVVINDKEYCVAAGATILQQI